MNFSSQIRCVIFDMDGVIIDSERLHKKAYYETFDYIGVKVSERLYDSLTGSSTINAFEKLKTHFNLEINPEKLVLEKRRRYVEYFNNDPSLKLVDGVEELIIKLHEKGIKLILASSSAMVNINRVFNRFNLDRFFSFKISGADLKTSKPHPEIFEKAVLLSRFSNKKCLVIEDSDNGIKAAKAANIDVVGFNNPLSKGQTLNDADYVINSFSELGFNSF